MNVTHDPESILAAWLDEGPTELPDATRRAILTSLPTIPQARRGPLAPWRFPLMNTGTRLAAAALVAIVAIGGALILIDQRPGAGGPSPAPTTTPAPSPIDTSAWTPFVSARFGLSFKVPAGWTAVPGQPSGPDPIGEDRALAPGQNAQFLVQSQPVPAGTTSATWLANDIHAMAAPPTGCPMTHVDAYAATIVDGHDGYLFEAYATCGFGRAIVFAGGRVYVLTGIPVTSPDGPPTIVDHAMFEAWLSTVRLDPATARDPVTPAPS